MNKVQIIKSLFWKLIERAGVQGITFVISLLLARLLTPEDYGMISLTTIFISISNVFVQSGLSTSIIQKKTPDSLDYSTVFYCSVVLSLLIYIILYLSSPYISVFFGIADLNKILRVLSLNIIFGAFISIQNAYASKKLMYKEVFKSAIIASVLSGIVGIIAAYMELGVWALVIQQLLSSILNCIILYLIIPWRPSLSFSLKRFKELFNFGSNILFSELVNNVFINLRGLVIGKFYTASALGYFNRGRHFPELIMNNVNGAIQSVMLVAYSSEQDNNIILKRMVRRSMKISAFIVFPLMIGMAVIAEPLVIVLLTEKWRSSVIYIQICALTFMWMPIHTANLQVIKAMGHSQLILKLELIRKIIELIVLIISIRFGVIVIALGEVFTTILSLLINLYPNKKLISYSIKEQFKDVLPSLSAAVIMAILIYPIGFLNINYGLQLIAQVFLGGVVYLIIAKLLRMESYTYLLNSVKELKSQNLV